MLGRAGLLGSGDCGPAGGRLRGTDWCFGGVFEDCGENVEGVIRGGSCLALSAQLERFERHRDSLLVGRPSRSVC